ncbi:hypothetical protein [Caulobacter sp. 17J65-9]|uniref:hypothetical protein n=1 Tax=Caulobacter sp. 17J65-9 TaxID=2709382 RepID=UPI0013C6204C|nr:hypothetical protein [Caulobacter sp. 17J65-9]NEX95166.1 hypothetical protein [Caulobacter sp. 17J65-9]
MKTLWVGLAGGVVLLAVEAAHAQQQESVEIAPYTCRYYASACTDPVERARREKEEQDRRDKLEADRLAKLKAQQEHQVQVTQTMSDLNMAPGRRAEVERLLQMKAAADAARPKPPAQQCWMESITHGGGGTLWPTRAEAEASVFRDSLLGCTSGHTVGPLTCNYIKQWDRWTCGAVLTCNTQRKVCGPQSASAQ